MNGVKTRIRRRRRKIQIRKSGKRISSPISIGVVRTDHLRCDRKIASQPLPNLSPKISSKRKPRRKKKMTQTRKAKLKQNSEMVRSWLNVEPMKQSMKISHDWPEEEAGLLTTDKPDSTTEMETPPKEGPNKSESAKGCIKKGKTSLNRLKTTDSLKAIRKRKSACIKSISVSSKIESIKEVMTPADSSAVLQHELAKSKEKMKGSTTCILRTSKVNRITSSKAISAIHSSTTESMDSVQKKVTDYMAYIKSINSRTGTDPIQNFKEVMKLVESRGSIPIKKRVYSKKIVSNVSVPTTIPRHIPIKRFASIPTTKGIQSTVSEKSDVSKKCARSNIPENITVNSAKQMETSAPLISTEVRRIIRRVESESYPSSAVSSAASK